MRGLEKDPELRYQTGLEFAEALQLATHVSRTPPSDPPRSQGVGRPCVSCGASVPPGLKFCGECGAKVSPPEGPGALPLTEPESPRASTRPPRMSEQGQGFTGLPLVGREAELSLLELARARASAGVLVPLRVVGEEGSGRRRLVLTVVENARHSDTLVVVTGPDPTWAGVPYAAVASCVRDLLGLRAAEFPVDWMDKRVAEGMEIDPTERAGFVEVFTEEGAVELDARARAEAAVRALIFALREGLRARGRTAFVVFEQIHRMDAASVRVLAGLLARPVPLGVFLVFTHGPRMHVPWARGETLHLGGIPVEVARTVLSVTRPGLDDLRMPPDEILPLHLEQLIRWNTEGGGTAPERMVDLIGARVERLPVNARRVLQALAVLGEAIPQEVAEVAGVPCDEAAVAMLDERGWVSLDHSRPVPSLRVAHPLLREVIDAGTPATLRKELHRACTQVEGSEDQPLEVRALHAEHGDDAFRSLLLLERVGDRALARGDDAAAALALRRGLEIARRELARGELDEPERAMVIFARKLGEALVRAGDASEAEGVLREGLGVATRGTGEWARLEGALGRALFARGRRAEGLRALDNAASVARRSGRGPWRWSCC
ncbi:MAG: AAA family ATPase [Polyangiales bacterium]